MTPEPILTRTTRVVTPTVTLLPTTGPHSLRIPEQRPETPCAAVGQLDGFHYYCTRADGHTGRHARVRHWAGGAVRAVWGD